MNRIKNRTFFLYVSLVIFVVLIVLFFCFNIHDSWKYLGVTDKNGFESINAAIALMGLIISTLTVIFVFVTYDSQSRQIKQNKSDTDYNRALDLVYRQYEVSKSKIDSHNLNGLISEFITLNISEATIPLELDYIIFENDNIQKYANVIHFIAQELEFTYHVLRKSHIEIDDKKNLASIIPNNINPYLVETLVLFDAKVRVYINMPQVKEENSKYLNILDRDSTKIMKYLFRAK